VMLYHIGRTSPKHRYHILAEGGHAICNILVSPRKHTKSIMFWGELHDVTCKSCPNYVHSALGWTPAQPDDT
jgi:hypothetical protein